MFKSLHKCPCYNELRVKKSCVIINEPQTSGKASINGIKAAMFFYLLPLLFVSGLLQSLVCLKCLETRSVSP